MGSITYEVKKEGSNGRKFSADLEFFVIHLSESGMIVSAEGQHQAENSNTFETIYTSFHNLNIFLDEADRDGCIDIILDYICDEMTAHKKVDIVKRLMDSIVEDQT